MFSETGKSCKICLMGVNFNRIVISGWGKKNDLGLQVVHTLPERLSLTKSSNEMRRIFQENALAPFFTGDILGET